MFYFSFFLFIIFDFSLLFYNSYRLYNSSINLTQYFEFIYKCYNPKIIVSLTSFKTRLLTIDRVIDSILEGTLIPDKIVLTLFYKDYYLISKKINEYFIKKNIEIIIVNIDIRPHKKYFFSMQKYPYDIIINIDDDILYEKSTIESLYNNYLKFPYYISARRVNLIKYNKTTGKALAYKYWSKDYTLLKKPSFDLLATGVGGILYPPNILKINYSLIYDLDNCITSDDLFLKHRENLFKIKTVWVPNNYLMGIKTIHQQGLYNGENIINNDKCLEKLMIYKI